MIAYLIASVIVNIVLLYVVSCLLVADYNKERLFVGWQWEAESKIWERIKKLEWKMMDVYKWSDKEYETIPYKKKDKNENDTGQT